MDLQLKGKKAIVTGGTARIGLAIARVLTEEGSEVTIPGRNSKKLSEAANLVAYVASPLSAATNGAALRVEGGLLRSIA
jgi:NAD(P)-dependent dehydrogenase (short-subunit alcohol dehydrogenase family)